MKPVPSFYPSGRTGTLATSSPLSNMVPLTPLHLLEQAPPLKQTPRRDLPICTST